MPATYDSIATTTLGADNNTITFSSISNSYTDLRIVFNGYATGAGTWQLRFNGTNTGYSTTVMAGSGGAARNSTFSSFSAIRFDNWYNGNDVNYPTFSQIDVFSYAGATNKSCLISVSNDRNGGGAVSVGVGLWQNTAAINSITLTLSASQFQAGTTASLYGILRA